MYKRQKPEAFCTGRRLEAAALNDFRKGGVKTALLLVYEETCGRISGTPDASVLSVRRV